MQLKMASWPPPQGDMAPAKDGGNWDSSCHSGVCCLAQTGSGADMLECWILSRMAFNRKQEQPDAAKEGERQKKDHLQVANYLPGKLPSAYTFVMSYNEIKQ